MTDNITGETRCFTIDAYYEGKNFSHRHNTGFWFLLDVLFKMSHEHLVIFLWGPRRLTVKFCDISSVNNCFIIILTHQKQNFIQEIQQLGKISLMVPDGCRSRVGLMTLMHGDGERYLQPRRSESQEEVRG